MKGHVACLLAIAFMPTVALPASILDLAWLSGCWSLNNLASGVRRTLDATGGRYDAWRKPQRSRFEDGSL